MQHANVATVSLIICIPLHDKYIHIRLTLHGALMQGFQTLFTQKIWNLRRKKAPF